MHENTKKKTNDSFNLTSLSTLPHRTYSFGKEKGSGIEGLEFLEMVLKLRNKFHMRIIIALVAHKGRILRKKP